MNKNIWIAGLLGLACLGCNVGSAPEPMNESQLKDAVDQLKPQDQINYIRSTPMPEAKKAERIAEIEKKYNIKADAPTPSQTRH